MNTHAWYVHFTKNFARIAGKSLTFVFAMILIFVWLISGPLFEFSNTWQLVINTATTIITFIMVFIIQNTQNRDTEAIQVKLDELIRVSKKAQNVLLDLEDLDDDQIDAFKAKYKDIAQSTRKNMKK
ncbi:MAG: low affinity iron permease family protein [Sulfurovaceae bacterium]